MDVTNRENCEKIFEKIKNKFKNIDTCFFSTGTWDPKKEKEIDIDQMKRVMEVNFFGTLNCIKAVEMYFKEKPSKDLIIKYNAMKTASLLRETMWSMVSEITSKIEFNYAEYTSDNLKKFEESFDKL